MYYWLFLFKEKESIYVLNLDGLKLRDIELRFLSRSRRQRGISLYKPNVPYVYEVSGVFLWYRKIYIHVPNIVQNLVFFIIQDYKQLEISFESQEDLDSWKASLFRVGVHPEKASNSIHSKVSAASMDPPLERQVLFFWYPTITARYIKIL